ncbi:sigma factor [Paenibacillus sp. IHBB 3054]|uniref:sigma factor n=1 Tax=Paenibacillus sp. IHBB 3054 TaxID=3425689 RepID=UPI003F67B39D
MEDEVLHNTINEVLGGNIDKFESILFLYQKPIVLYCYHMLGSYPEAEDSAQEVFLKAYRSLSTYNPDVPFAAWLYKITYRRKAGSSGSRNALHQV